MSHIKIVTGTNAMKMLVVQLGDAADVLRSLMALRGAKQNYPQIDIHFIVRKKHSEPLKYVSWISNIYELDVDGIVGPLLRKESTEEFALEKIINWLAQFSDQNWDFVVNWTFDEISSYLMALIPGSTKLGYSRYRDLSLSHADGWSQYVQSTRASLISQNIHLTDIYATQLLTAIQVMIGEPQADKDSSITNKNFFEFEKNDHDIEVSRNDYEKKWIAVFVDAEKNNHNWTEKNWAHLISEIISNHPECHIVLMGDKKAAKINKRILNNLEDWEINTKKIISLIGDEDFSVTAQIISECRWVVTENAAVLQLAGLLGTRILYISKDSFINFDKSPYGNGHWIVSLGSERTTQEHLRESLVDEYCFSELVYFVWKYASHEWVHGRNLTLSDYLTGYGIEIDKIKSIKISRSKVRSMTHGGGVCYELMNNLPINGEEWVAQVVGYLARSWYCGWAPEPANEVERDRIMPEIVRELRMLIEPASVLKQLYSKSIMISNEISQVASKLRSQNIVDIEHKQRLSVLGGELAELEKLAEKLSAIHPYFTIFTSLSKVMMHNLNDANLKRLGEQGAMAYGQLLEGVKLFEEWIRATINVVRPQEVVQNKFRTAKIIPLKSLQ